MSKKSTRDAILDAAERVIQSQGMTATTIEGVAAAAGVSKGGLFYHFASKKELLLQLLARYETRLWRLREEILASLPESPNRMARASVMASMRQRAESTANPATVLSLLDDVALREKITDIKARFFREAGAASKKPERTALAMLAIDGLWMMEVFCDGVMPEEFMKKIITEILRLVDDDPHAHDGEKSCAARKTEDRK